MEHVTLPVLDEARERAVTREVLEVSPSSDGTLTLLHSPALVDGLAGGDVIMLAPESLSGFQLVRRGGNVSIVLVLPAESGRAAPATEKLIADLKAQGATYEGGPDRTLVFTAPVGSAFGTTERILAGFCATSSGASWWFGNVYDAQGTPLGWWE